VAGSLPRVSAGNGAAIGMMVAAMMLFTGMDTIGKVLSADQPVQQVVWGRYFFQFAWMLLLIPFYGLRALTQTKRLGTQMTRGFLVALATICLFTAVSVIPLADAYTISFVAPFIVTILSIPLLGERVGWRRWSAILVGFLGVLVVIRPGFGVVHWALLLPLVTATCFAFYQILTRKIGALPSERPLALLFYMAFAGTLALSSLTPFYWEPVSPQAWAGMVAMGLLASIGHLLLIKALALASAVTLSPFIYTQLIWAIIIGFFLFGDGPDGWMLLGGSIIIASGLFVFYREARRAGQ
jgi:drug/metabolite transporter (DMT)-like permease